MRYNRFLWLGIILTLFSCQDSTPDIQIQEPKKEALIRVLDKLLVTKADEGLIYYRGNPFTGHAITLNDEDQMSASIAFVDGIKNGVYKKWFKNGTLSFEAHYTDGLQNGSLKTWFKNGNLRSEGSIVLGVPHGLQKQYYKGGQKFKFINLVSGKEEGLQRSWRENGKLYSNYEARNGRIFGLKRASLCYQLKDEEIQIKY